MIWIELKLNEVYFSVDRERENERFMFNERNKFKIETCFAVFRFEMELEKYVTPMYRYIWKT